MNAHGQPDPVLHQVAEGFDRNHNARVHPVTAAVAIPVEDMPLGLIRGKTRSEQADAGAVEVETFLENHPRARSEPDPSVRIDRTAFWTCLTPDRQTGLRVRIGRENFKGTRASDPHQRDNEGLALIDTPPLLAMHRPRDEIRRIEPVSLSDCGLAFTHRQRWI